MRNPTTAPQASPRHVARVLTRNDLDRVVSIDHACSGHYRQHFFEKRFEAASKRPRDYVLVGVTVDGRLHGFAIARVLGGEYGRKDAVAVVDALGVDPDSRERGVGQSLMHELIDSMQKQGICAVQSQAHWKDHDLLRFFDSSHFELAARIALERPVTDLRAEEDEEV